MRRAKPETDSTSAAAGRAPRCATAAALTLIATTTASAAIFDVTSEELTGPGSLLEAVQLANDTPGPDTIQFDPDLRIDLTSNDRASREGVVQPVPRK